MKKSLFALLTVAALASTGCYHATVTTGLTPGTIVIDQPWAMSFVYGLVPPPTVEAAGRCSDGVAVVETELSFLNGLVSFVTAGIVTPMHITVTCAASGSASAVTPGEEILIPESATQSEVIGAFGVAAERAVETNAAVYVRFE